MNSEFEIKDFVTFDQINVSLLKKRLIYTA